VCGPNRAHTQIAHLDDHAAVWSAEVSSLVWKIIEVIGESNESFANAVRNAVEEAGKTVKQMQWFEATQFRGTIKEGKVTQFQAVVRIGFKVER
jgi:flavin-binding protein dodecin